MRLLAKWQMRAGFRGICLAFLCATATIRAGNLDDLLGQKDLTPEGLARVMADFSFELTPQLQEPNSFLQRKRGDCADYANLASLVLTHRGYTTKLVVVMMSKQTHVVCYVKEIGGFLDYNHRADAHPVMASDGSLEDIAGKVAGDFGSPWWMASFFRYRETAPVYLDSVFAPGSARKPSARGLANHKAKDKYPGQASLAPKASLTAVGVQAMIN